MKKFLSAFMCIVMIITVFTACAKQQDMNSDIVLITDGGTISDNGYNQSAWEGVSQFALDNSMKCRYFQPVLEDGKITVDNIEKYVELASKGNAQFVVMPGSDFAVSAYELASSYPDIKFILIGSLPHSEGDSTDRIIKNVMSVSFDSLQAGFLAGYIAVANGNTSLGYFGEFDSKDSASYGAGFVQGAAYCADDLGVPVTVDWAEYDSALRDYIYDFTVTACYKKIDDSKEKTYTVKVVDGLGSGTYAEGSNVAIVANPAPKGKVFDKWVVKSDTQGVKDKKVNISSKTKSTINLIAEKCDCTLTATYKDIEGTSYSVEVMTADTKSVAATYNVGENGEVEITAPVAEANYVFDHWETNSVAHIENNQSAVTKISGVNEDVRLIPVYRHNDTPTFNLNVVTGEGGNGTSIGSGSYLAGDMVNIVSAPPKDGYMFSHWENKDAYGNSTGIAMDNEYNYSTSFEMVDRYSAICDTMYNHGVSTIFSGGNSKSDSVFTSKNNYDYSLNVITAGIENGDSYTSIVNDYGTAVKNCLADFKGGSVYLANCSNNGIYASFVSDNEEIKASYDEVYSALASGAMPLTPVQGGAGYDFCKLYNEQKPSKCLTLNGWFLKGVSLK